MSLLTPVDREFATLPSGFVRDKVVLANFRGGLRRLINPETGVLFTEDEIALATRPGTRWYREAQAIDDYGQLRQRNALFLADQIRMDRATSEWLLKFHGQPRIGKYLSGTGADGKVRVRGTVGTIVQGSTTIGAPGVYTARAPNGAVFQVFITTMIASSNGVLADMVGVTTGAHTNLPVGTTLTWITRDPNMQPECVVEGEPFRNGTDQETDAEYLRRLLSFIRHRPAAGNDAHVREWGRAASNAVLDAFVYPCAFHAGSSLVAIMAKRAGTEGPNALIPSSTLLAIARSYLIPPGSPVSQPGFRFVTAPDPEPSDVVVRLTMNRGTDAGWADVRPFPTYHATTPQVTQVVSTSPTVLRVHCPGDAHLPGYTTTTTVGGANCPRMMIWDESKSRFFELELDTVQDEGSNIYKLTLDGNPTDWTPAVGQFVSPAMARHELVALAVESYFDEVGPGQLFDLNNDVRGGRCVRFVEESEEFPSSIGSAIGTRIREAMGGASSNDVVASISKTSPSYPTQLTSGPKKLVAGKFAIYEV